jgi:hypothetical protein
VNGEGTKVWGDGRVHNVGRGFDGWVVGNLKACDENFILGDEGGCAKGGDMVDSDVSEIDGLVEVQE